MIYDSRILKLIALLKTKKVTKSSIIRSCFSISKMFPGDFNWVPCKLKFEFLHEQAKMNNHEGELNPIF